MTDSINNPVKFENLSQEDKAEVYKYIDDANAEYMKSINAPEPIFSEWVYHEGGMTRKLIGHGVTSKSWSSL